MDKNLEEKVPLNKSNNNSNFYGIVENDKSNNNQTVINICEKSNLLPEGQEDSQKSNGHATVRHRHSNGDNSFVINPNNASTSDFSEENNDNENKQSNLLQILLKILAVFCLLYLFICSLTLMSDSLRLIAGRAAGEVLKKEKLLTNPIVGVMIGILVTVLLQSSSTSTSIFISCIASGLIELPFAINLIMGSNIGTSATNTIVAFTSYSKRENFERAFSGSVLHDMFNFLTVGILLPLEVLTSYLQVSSTMIIDRFHLQESNYSSNKGEVKMLSQITKPFTTLIVQINKKVLIGWSLNDPEFDNERLLKVWCNKSVIISSTINSTSDSEYPKNGESETISKKCKFLFNLIELGDMQVGLILLGISLTLLCGCLILLVRVLSSLLKGKVAVTVQQIVNAQIPKCPFLSGYIAMIIGAVLTIIVQSSSVFTSTLVPLISMGMITLDRAYPLTLGSNIGTTSTSLLASLATEGPNLRLSIQLALCHFLFNFTGIMLFYPIPFMRFPIRMAESLGKITGKYRWFAIFYLFAVFILMPLSVFILSLIGNLAFYIVFSIIATVTLLILSLKFIQVKFSQNLPIQLRTMEFLPLWLTSLEPYDRMIEKVCCFLRSIFSRICPKYCSQFSAKTENDKVPMKNGISNNSSSAGLDNPAFLRGSGNIIISNRQNNT